MKHPPLALPTLVAALLLVAGTASAESPSLGYLNRVLAGSEAGADKAAERIAGGGPLLPDDPANYAIYELLEKEIRGLGAAIGNQGDLLAFYRYEDGLLEEMGARCGRIEELLVEAGDGILDPADLGVIKDEVDGIYADILDTLSRAEFNQLKVFSDLAAGAATRNLLASGDHYRLDRVRSLEDDLLRERGRIGALENGLERSMAGAAIEAENAAASAGRGTTDLAADIAELQRERLLVLVDLLMLRKGTTP